MSEHLHSDQSNSEAPVVITAGNLRPGDALEVEPGVFREVTDVGSGRHVGDRRVRIAPWGYTYTFGEDDPVRVRLRSTRS